MNWACCKFTMSWLKFSVPLVTAGDRFGERTTFWRVIRSAALQNIQPRYCFSRNKCNQKLIAHTFGVNDFIFLYQQGTWLVAELLYNMLLLFITETQTKRHYYVFFLEYIIECQGIMLCEFDTFTDNAS